MTAKTKTILAAFLFFFSMHASAQRVSYEVLEDDPYAIKQLTFRIYPFYAEAFKTNTASLGGGLELRCLLLDKLIFQVNNWKSYSTIAENERGDKFITRDFVAEYILSDKAKKDPISIVLSESVSQSSNGTYSTSKYIEVPGTTRTITGLRGGVYNYQSPFRVDDLKKANEIMDTAGLMQSGFSYGDYLVKSTNIFAGLSLNVIRNIKIDAVGYGKAKSSEKWMTVYLDLMYGPLVSLEGLQKNRIGWRYGFLADWHTTKSITFSGRVELGSRTGIKKHGFYLFGGFAMSVNLFKKKSN